MNDKLTIKELAAYLPWEIEVLHFDSQFRMGYEKHKLCGLTENTRYKESDLRTDEKHLLNIREITYWLENKTGLNSTIHDIKPALYPLSHLTKEIEHKGERFVPVERWGWFGENFNIKYFNHANFKPNFEPYYKTEQMLACHFDVFRLIERGLVIDKNTIQ